MANEYKFHRPDLSGQTLYAIQWQWDESILRETGLVWDNAGDAYEAPGATIADYTITLTEDGTALGLFTGSKDAALPLPCLLIVYVQGGDDPAWGDLAVLYVVVSPTGVTVSGHTTAAKAEIKAEVADALQARGVTSAVMALLDVAVSTRNATTPLSASQTRDAVGLAAANLDTQLGDLAAYVDTEVAAILTRLPAALIGGRMDSDVQSIAAGVTSAIVTAIFAHVVQTAAKASAADDVDFDHWCRLVLSGLPFGVTADTGTVVTHKTPAGGDTLGSVTVDSDGNRTAVTIAADPGA